MRAVDRLCDAMAIVAGVYLTVIMFGIVFQAMARTLGYSGSSHIFTFTEFGLLYIAMLASPWLVRLRGHVYIEIFTAVAPERFRRPISRMVAVVSVLICAILTWYTVEAAQYAYVRGDMDMRSVDMPRWLLLGSMPICFGLMGIQFLRFIFGEEVMHSGEAGVHE